MKRLLRGSVVLAVAVGFLSCSGDPTDSFREPSGIVANPTTLFIDVGETKPVIAALQDDQGNQIAADYEITAVGAGITVVQDTTFQNTTAPGVSIDNQVRFQVTGSAIANSSFTLSAGGQSLVVPVRVTPATVSIGISNPVPALGDTIVLTALAGVLFTDSSEVTFAGGPPGDIVSVSADQTQLTVVPGPNTLGVVTVAHTTVSYDQGLDFTVTSQATETVTSPALIDLTGAVFSNQTPILGEVVTLTLPATVKVLPVAALPPTSIGAPDTIGVLADSGFIVEGATNPMAVAVSVDSSVISFIPAPNSDSVITVRGVVHQRLPQFPLILQTTLKVTTPTVDSLPSSLSSAASPAVTAVNTPVVLTSTNVNFTFVAPGVVTVAGTSTIVTGQTATTLTFLPRPSSTGNVAVGAVDVVGFGLPLPSTAPSITTGVAPSAPGTDNPATAPILALPALGGTTGFYDAGTFQADVFAPDVDQVYRIVSPGASSYRVTVDWDNAADIDVALCGEATCATPNFAAGTAAHPESTVYTFTGAGTNYLVLDLFAGVVPVWVSIQITRIT